MSVEKRGEFEDTKKGNQNSYIEEEHKEKVQKDKQRSTKHTRKTKDRVPRTPLKTRGQLRWSGRVRRSCSTSDTRRVNLVTNPSNQNYVFRQRKNQIISFFCKLYKNVLIEDCRIKLIKFVSFKSVCFHKIWRQKFVLEEKHS